MEIKLNNKGLGWHGVSKLYKPNSASANTQNPSLICLLCLSSNTLDERKVIISIRNSRKKKSRWKHSVVRIRDKHDIYKRFCCYLLFSGALYMTVTINDSVPCIFNTWELTDFQKLWTINFSIYISSISFPTLWFCLHMFCKWTPIHHSALI